MEGIPNITSFKKRLTELDEQMSKPDFFQNARHAQKISRERQTVSELLQLYEQLEHTEEEIEENQSLLTSSQTEPEFLALVQEELVALKEKRTSLREAVLVNMLPEDIDDSRNVVMEIRAGAGGQEASLFVGELYRMYLRYAESRKWQIEPLNSHPSELGGFKEICFLVTGEAVNKYLKFESGVHRVQRVPVTESCGRIHTSTVTVAVLPEAEEVDLEIDSSDLEISIARASGPGGQGVNTTDSAVQILHKPTGMIVKCADERSQLKNKNKALKVLYARLLEKKQLEERAKYAADRRSQVGSGDRSERIRTYNFPQSRVTDHRIGVTLHNLPLMMEGQMDEMIGALQEADQRKRVEELLSL